MNQREAKEHKENSFLRFSLMLAERNSERDVSCNVMQDHADHQSDECCETLAHSKGDSLEDRVNA
jgi:hypothetical protein